MFGLLSKKSEMVAPGEALPGRETPIPMVEDHAVFHRKLSLDLPEGQAAAIFGMGCFWGVERLFWQQSGVTMTLAGYGGGYTPNPTYEEVCTGKTGHTEVVWVAYDPAQVSYEDLLSVFWENHDPTQGMRQGNDRGTQYRSAIYWTSDAQREAAEASRTDYATRLKAAGYGAISTEIAEAGAFYWAEDYHQQYLHKHPNGYCGLAGTGVTCPIGTGA